MVRLVAALSVLLLALLVVFRLHTLANADMNQYEVESVAGLHRYVVEEDNVICYYNVDMFTSSLSCVRMD